MPKGITVTWVAHDPNYDVRFPEALFEEDGKPKRMLQRRFKLYSMFRWEMNGRTYAYSYSLGPYDVACAASVDIIDDRGDGKFRLMTSPGHSLLGSQSRSPDPPQVPDWLGKPTL